MSVYLVAALFVFVALAAVLTVRYILLSVDCEFRDLARAVEDGEYRRRELARLDRELAAALPLPEDAGPIPRPGNSWLRTVPAALFGVGIVVLWGGVFAPAAERNLWLGGGGAAVAVAVVVMLATIGRRRLGRMAGLVRLRADLRRLDADRRGESEDRALYLRFAPWDDAAWAELAECEAALGDVGAALRSLSRARGIDRHYDDYYAAAVGLALQDGGFGESGRILDAWEENTRDPRPEADVRRTAYRAALALAEGDGPRTRELLDKAAGFGPEALEACLRVEEALAPLAEFSGRSA